jgi:GMP synthase (glutamine-hydrolysing)
MDKHETLIILDFGSQYTQLIARRAREMGVFSIILPFNTPIEEIKSYNLRGIILSGGPNSVYEPKAPKLDKNFWNDIDVPILGICYGLQLMTLALGGKVEASPSREYGEVKISIGAENKLLDQALEGSTVWMSHGDHVAKLPRGFRVTAKSGNIVAAIEDTKTSRFGFQFHPEVSHSEKGGQMLLNFLNICGFSRHWRAGSVINEQITYIKNLVGQDNVVCALSGGVDSSIAATIVDRAVGMQQTCIFVDHGLLRQDEYEQILENYQKTGLNVKPVRASTQFMNKLKGVTDPEKKRKIIGAEFIKIFEREAKKISNVKFLVQGTLYPDVITSGGIKGAAVIKSHHNVGGLPEKMNLKLIEPLRNNFKDEVRIIGKELGLPKEIVERQPFPGPGLAVRIVGEITQERLRLLRQADAIVRQEIESRPRIRKQLYHFFAVLLPIKSVGVMGDSRTYQYTVAIKCVRSEDIMTADWARLPYNLLALMSSRIVREVNGINRVVYEITTKPPATIEWE